MTAPEAPLQELEAQLWQGQLAAPLAPQDTLTQALHAGASYRTILHGLRRLWRMALPGAKIAALARTRWPKSIDMALLDVILGPPERAAGGLAHLQACVMQANRRRAALSDACMRLNKPVLAREVLAEIDLQSQTAADDIQRRVELALASGDFAQARADIGWLSAQGHTSVARSLTLQLVYRQHGARAVAATLAQARRDDARFHALAFDILLNEGDYARAGDILARWRAVSDASGQALARAQSRFALERGEAQTTLAMLEDRLDMAQPWTWDAADHLQWIRAGLAMHAEPRALRAHALAALRIHPRHDGLAHIARLAREAVEDWQDLEYDLLSADSTPSRALITARDALRLGLSGRAAVLCAQARRSASARDAQRLNALRAEALLAAGRPQAAQQALHVAQALACDAVQTADAALLIAEFWLEQGAPEQASQALAPLEDAFPDRMPLWLAKARIAFQSGDFAAATHAVARFNAFKSTQIGKAPVADLRDRIIQNAASSALGVEPAFQPHLPVADSVRQAGLERIAASPGLAACLLARSQTQGQLGFVPAPRARIPRQIAHYWQGPQGPALARARARWQAMHPQFDCRVFDADSARDWLKQAFDSGMADRFTALTQPAARADLFRLCWIARMGGVFADLDEYPRIPVTPWLEHARAVFCLERGFGTIANNFIAAEPDHPACLRALDFACAALDDGTPVYPWWHTGPAQWTRAVFAYRFGQSGDGLRVLSQTEYGRHVATNLPYPHKRSPDHWR